MNFVVTLVERDYLHGACALYNSLALNGFDGIFVVGYRNKSSMPSLPWFELEKQVDKVRLIELRTSIHFTNYKPAFMLSVLESNPDCSSITYIDPDILVNIQTNWLLSWSQGGPAVCADVNWWMPSTHPTRRQWDDMFNYKVFHELNFYVNGGFLSVLRRDMSFLDLWQEVISNADCQYSLYAKGEIYQWRGGGRETPFMALDQDALNVALMSWNGSITMMGPDAMGFNGSSYIPHAIGTPKPWQKHFILQAFQGNPPREVDKLYWKYANSQLRSHHFLVIIVKSISLMIASILSRFYAKR